MKSYTYAIGWSKTNVWYYGVRYSSKMYVGDIWKTYFTSSNTVKEYVKMYGNPDIIKVTRVFETVDDGIAHETKFLNKVKAWTNPFFLNCHNAPAFPWKSFDKNSMHIPKVKEKMIRTKKIQGLIKFLRNRKWKPSRNKNLISRIEGYISLMEGREKRCDKIEKLLRKRLELCVNYTRKPYPKNRKSNSRGKIKAISDSKIGKRAYTCQETKIVKMFGPDDSIPENFKKGMVKKTPNNNTQETRKKISEAMVISRENESDEKKKQRLKKYHETLNKRRLSCET